jgi:hypothetical protein
MSKNLNYKTPERYRQRANEYYKKNKEKCLMQRKEYYNLHRTEILEREKSLRAFPEYGIAKREYDKQKYQKNKAVIKLQRKKYYYNNRPKIKHRILSKTYGISLEDFHQKWSDQNGCCDICRKGPFDINKIFNRLLVVDHDHKTRQIRGLLCNSCNRALGLFQDNNNLIQNASKYLTKWSNTYVESERHQS